MSIKKRYRGPAQRHQKTTAKTKNRATGQSPQRNNVADQPAGMRFWSFVVINIVALLAWYPACQKNGRSRTNQDGTVDDAFARDATSHRNDGGSRLDGGTDRDGGSGLFADMPSESERAMLVFMNRWRAEPNPSQWCPDSHESPLPQLAYDQDLAQAARFHCVHSYINNGGLSHKSYCTLRDDIESTGCNGEADCSCQPGTECWQCGTLNGCGTSPAERDRIFGFTGSGTRENGGAAGGGGWDATFSIVLTWATECGHGNNGAHRSNLLSAGSNVVGPGVVLGPQQGGQGGQCMGSYYFADFGHRDGVETPRMPAGIYWRSLANGAPASFFVTYYDASGQDPDSVFVVLDGTCHEMNRELGVPGNRGYRLAQDLPVSECHEYYFVAKDTEGNLFFTPKQGAYATGDCPSDKVASRQSAPCAQ